MGGCGLDSYASGWGSVAPLNAKIKNGMKLKHRKYHVTRISFLVAQDTEWLQTHVLELFLYFLQFLKSIKFILAEVVIQLYWKLYSFFDVYKLLLFCFKH
jgi:hypothetical protein